ncbi:hypothetical protein [Streptomyces flaveus]|uniref:hypothetical protein n=1 Tax=Streptomyces flaveus TaxID=66370 RepID=UPI00331E71A5
MRTGRRFFAGAFTAAAVVSTLALGPGVAVADGGTGSPELFQGGQFTQPSEASSPAASTAGQYTVLCIGGGCVD